MYRISELQSYHIKRRYIIVLKLETINPSEKEQQKIPLHFFSFGEKKIVEVGSIKYLMFDSFTVHFVHCIILPFPFFRVKMPTHPDTGLRASKPDII